MGVTIDKSRGNTIVEGVSVKTVTEGGSAALAKSPRGVGLKLGMYNVVDIVLTYSKSLVVTCLGDSRVLHCAFLLCTNFASSARARTKHKRFPSN